MTDYIILESTIVNINILDIKTALNLIRNMANIRCVQNIDCRKNIIECESCLIDVFDKGAYGSFDCSSLSLT